jgi:carbamate kinase
MNNGSLIVVALGGNAISRADQEGNVEQQFANSRITAKALAELIEAGHQLVITHGNGPQIGNFLLRNEAAANMIYPLPMEVAAAHVQGGMGFMIAQCVMNELAARGRAKLVTTIVTTVLVDAEDPSFENPTKPIGQALSRTEAERYKIGEGWAVKEVEPGKWRRVVASPQPRRITELPVIRRLVEAGDLVITCGGGGIPVVHNSEQGYRGARAVIDKDLASALLAAELNASTLMILTAVDRVSINFNKANQQVLEKMTVQEARRFLNEGQFPPGSMGPKVQGAVQFLEASQRPDAQAIIGPLHHAADALSGKTGTRITR